MAQYMAGYYVPEESQEHAVIMSGGFTDWMDPGSERWGPRVVVDVGQDPNWTSAQASVMSSAYAPTAKAHYAFWLTRTNQIRWIAWSLETNTVPEPKYGLVQDLSVGWPNGWVVDISAFYSALDDHLYVVAIMNDGEIVSCNGQPWQRPTDADWSVTGPSARIIGATNLTTVGGPDGYNHIFVAKGKQANAEISEIWFIPKQETGENPIWTYSHALDGISCYFTLDGVCHIIAASLLTSASLIEEIAFTPAQVPPTNRSLAEVPFGILDIAGNEVPSLGEYLIMKPTTVGPPDNADLYLGNWNNPALEDPAFQYGPWPVRPGPSVRVTRQGSVI